MPVFNKMVYNGTEYILGGGGNIGEPLNLTVTTSGLNATIKWEDNEIGTIPPTTFQKSELVRKIGSAPTSPSDGDLVVTETVKDTYKTTGYVDQGLTDGTTYYYRVFSYSDLGGISYCDAVSVTPSAGGWQPGVNTVAYYEFDNDLTDSSGNGHNLSVRAGAVTYGVDASGGKYAYFDTNTWTYAYSSFPQIDTTAITLSYWWQPKQIFTSGNELSVAYTTTSNTILLATNRSIGFWNLPGEITATSDTWYHLCVTIGGGNLTSYINGVQYETGSFSAPGTTSTKLVINNAWDTDSSSFANDNYISELIIENKSRTAQEVSDYFDLTKGDYGIS